MNWYAFVIPSPKVVARENRQRRKGHNRSRTGGRRLRFPGRGCSLLFSLPFALSKIRLITTGFCRGSQIMLHRSSRRQFLKSATAAGIGVGFWSGRGSGREGKVSANERLHVGVIGVAGQGRYDMDQVAQAGAEIVALCD